MTLKLRILALLILYAHTGLSQLTNSSQGTSSKTRFVSFVVDGKKKKIDNNFRFIIVHNNDTTLAKVKGNTLIVPDLDDRLDYTVIFKYKGFSLSFNDVSKKMLFPGQDYNWEFGVDNRPFDESLDLMTSGEYVADKTSRQLQYLRLDPIEFGDGIRFVNKIDHSGRKTKKN